MQYLHLSCKRKFKMKKDIILEVLNYQDCFGRVLFNWKNDIRCVNSKADILDEDGKMVCWNEHDLYKNIRYVYYDVKKKKFWLPKSKLYNKKKLKRFKNNKNLDDLSFFNKAYFLSLLGIKYKPNGFSGLFK